MEINMQALQEQNKTTSPPPPRKTVKNQHKMKEKPSDPPAGYIGEENWGHLYIHGYCGVFHNKLSQEEST